MQFKSEWRERKRYKSYLAISKLKRKLTNEYKYRQMYTTVKLIIIIKIILVTKFCNSLNSNLYSK